MTHPRRLIVLGLTLGLALGAAACIYTNPSPKRDPNALSPLGVRGAIVVGPREYAGELLAVDERSFVLLTTERLVVIPFNVAARGDFPSAGVGTYGAPWTTHSEQLRMASRFPYGIPAPAMAAMLRAKGQTAPDTVRPNP